MNSIRRVTQRDVARRLGYDKSTVSLALSGSSRVARATRERITRVAEELGYRPDPAISLLARHRWAGHEVGAGSVVAYLVARDSEFYPLQVRHLSAVRTRAGERGYRVEEFDLSLYPTGRAASRVLYNRGIRGLILPALPRSAARYLESMEWSKFTVVGCSHGWLRSPCDVVAVDVFESTRQLWRNLASRGYRRIGAALFRHDPTAIDDYVRVGASHAEQASLPPGWKRLPFHLGGIGDREAFMRWFLEHRPDVILSSFSRPYEWLISDGFDVPDEVAFASLNVLPGSNVSGMALQREEIGVRAVDYLLSAIRENRWGCSEVTETVLLAPRWTEGATLPFAREELRNSRGLAFQSSAAPKSNGVCRCFPA